MLSFLIVTPDARCAKAMAFTPSLHTAYTEANADRKVSPAPTVSVSPFAVTVLTRRQLPFSHHSPPILPSVMTVGAPVLASSCLAMLAYPSTELLSASRSAPAALAAST